MLVFTFILEELSCLKQLKNWRLHSDRSAFLYNNWWSTGYYDGPGCNFIGNSIKKKWTEDHEIKNEGRCWGRKEGRTSADALSHIRIFDFLYMVQV